MPLNPNPLADLLAAVDAALARLLAPLGRDLARLVARAGGGLDGAIPTARRAGLLAFVADAVRALFGAGPAGQFDPDGRPLTPIARLIAASTRAAVRLAVEPPGTPRSVAPTAARVAPSRPIFDPTRTWVAPDGYTLSDRVWQAGADVEARINAMLDLHIRRGTPAGEIAADLARFLAPRGGPGGVADYRARRLAFTETSRAYGAGVVEAARDNPLATGVRWRLAPGHDRAADAGICARHAARDVGLGPGVWERGKPIPFPGHPSCRCSLVAVARQGDPRDVAAYVPPDVEALVATLTGFPATGG